MALEQSCKLAHQVLNPKVKQAALKEIWYKPCDAEVRVNEKSILA